MFNFMYESDHDLVVQHSLTQTYSSEINVTTSQLGGILLACTRYKHFNQVHNLLLSQQIDRYIPCIPCIRSCSLLGRH